MKHLKVLVTRPKEQGERLATSLSANGFEPILAPMIKIAELGQESRSGQVAALQRLADADGVIAISSNAFAFAYRLAQHENVRLPEDLKWFAVGKATAEAMRSANIYSIVPKSRFDTEGLLSLPDFDNLKSKRLVVLAGKGGRRKLELALRERGAEVDRIEMYERIPLSNTDVLIEQDPDVIIAMSGETVESLSENLEAAGRSEWLRKPLLVPSARTAHIAFSRGFQKVRITENASEESLLQVLCRLASEV